MLAYLSRMFSGTSGTTAAGDQVDIVSSIDDRTYRVNNTELKVDVANTIALLRRNVLLLILRIREYEKGTVATAKHRMYLKRISDRIQTTVFLENPVKKPRLDVTSYNVNKGDQIFLCMVDYRRNNGDGKLRLFSLNTLFYVVLHEVSHIGSGEWGHGTEFDECFTYLLSHASRLNLYSKYLIEDTYCGLDMKFI